MPKKPNTAEDFWNKIDRTNGPDKCWPFVHTWKTNSGYGMVSYRNKKYQKSPQWLAHRLAYCLTYEFPKGLVCHTCDNPPCCNPKHLFIGTHKDNSRDMVNKKRQAVGTRVKGAKLNDEIVSEIREKYARRPTKHLKIAKKYGVSRSLVGQLLARKIWKHV